MCDISSEQCVLPYWQALTRMLRSFSMMTVLYQLLLEDRDDGIRTEANKDSPIP